MLNISYLEALKAEDILKIIHWAKGVPADVAYAVQEQSGGHPFIAQYLMYRIYEFGTSKTTRAVVTDLASRFMSERYADLAKWQLEIGEAGQRTYAVLAEADGWLTVDQVRKLVNTPKLNIQRWLDILCYHGLAVRDHQYNYRLTGELFKAWFKSNILTSLRGSHTNPESAYSLHASRSIKVFYLYAPEDEDLLVDLEKQLASMRRMGLITDWHSGKIGPGREISQEIEHHLNTCEIIVLLISPDFIASDNIYGVSQQALERHFAGTAHVVPVILRPVVWKWTLFEELKVLPANRKPITIWSNRDEAFVEVANGIRVIVEQLSSSI